MKRIILALAFLCGSSSSATAKILVKELTQDLVFDVHTYPGHALTLEFPEPVTQDVLGNKIAYHLEKLDDTHFVLSTKAGAPRSNLNMGTWSGHAVMRLRQAASEDDAVLHIRFIPPRSRKPDEQRELTPQLKRSLRHRAVAEFAMQTKVVVARDVQEWRSGNHQLALHVGHISHGEDLGVFPFAIHNDSDFSYPITAFHLRDHLDRPVTASLHVQPGVLDDDSQLVPGASVNAAFVLESPEQLRAGWILRLKSIDSVSAAKFKARPPRRFVAGKLEFRTLVTVHGTGGSTSLSDHLGLQRSAWGMMSGAGLRISHGPTRYTAIDGGVDVVQTEDVVLDTEQGTIETSAVGGRLHVGGMLHTGHTVTPYVRLGLGVTFARHRFSMGGASESEVRLAGVIFFGGGVDWWINDRFAVGLGLGSSVPFGGQDTGLAFEAGLRVGIAFGKLRNRWRID